VFMMLMKFLITILFDTFDHSNCFKFIGSSIHNAQRGKYKKILKYCVRQVCGKNAGELDFSQGELQTVHR